MNADYVIVGAGSAGCVLASRLSDDPDVSVCLIEAGGPDSYDEIHIPAALGMLFKSRLDWDFNTEPESALLGRRVYLARGRALGGSSTINAMIYMRGNRADYDAWAAGGAEGWGYQDVLPYFKRSEDNEWGESEFHGAGGPLSVSDSRSNLALVDHFIEAASSAGHPINDDFNGITQDGVGRFQFTQRGGMRWSTASAFLRPAMARGNLTVMTSTLACRVVLDGQRATGVEVEQDGMLQTVHASEEVVICAGTYQSPQILMLSGIGPADELAPLQIEPRADLPVGKNLHDHVMAVPSWLTSEETLFSAFTPENFGRLQESGTGPLTSNAAEGGGFFYSRAGLDAPDLQLHAVPLMLHQGGTGPLLGDAFSVFAGLVTPTSRGEVLLRSPLPSAQPRIIHNYLSTEEDIEGVVAAVRLAMEFAARSPLADSLTKPFVGPADDSDAAIRDFVIADGQTLFHPTSTCAIGSVVDSELRVVGVEGLRVADASVMPSAPRGNTNAPTIMIAEKAADLIRGIKRGAEPAEISA